MCKWTVVLRVRGSGKDSCRGTADGGIESDSSSAIAIVVCRRVVINIQGAGRLLLPRVPPACLAFDSRVMVGDNSRPSWQSGGESNASRLALLAAQQNWGRKFC